MKKFTFRTVLIAALIVVSMMAVAFAATNSGLMNWFQNDYGAALPQSAQEILSATDKTALDTELVTFHVNEMMCDGKIAYMTVEAQLKDGQSAILYPDCWEPDDQIGEMMAQKLNHPEVTAESSYLEAATATGLPLYSVNAYLEVTGDAMVDSEMMDGSVLENGNLLLVRMLYIRDILNGENLPVTIVGRVAELDTNSLEFVEDSRQENTVAYPIPIHGVTAERSYAPEEPAKLFDCFTLTKVDAKQTCAGVYVTIYAQLDKPMTVQECMDASPYFDVLDAEGNSFPIGLSLTGEHLDMNGQPMDWLSEEMLDGIQFQMMISADELPDSMIVTDGTAQVVVK